MALDYSRTPCKQEEDVADRSRGGIVADTASIPRNVGGIQHSMAGHQANRTQPSSATASGKPMMHGEQHMSVMDAFNQMKRLLDRLENERIARRVMSENRLMWVQEESQVDMRLAKLGYSASSSSAFGRTRSRSPDEMGNSHSAFREPRVISTTPINNMQEHEKLSWSASPRGTKSPVLDAQCGVLDDVVRSQTDRRIYVSKLEELRAELIRKCPELADSVMKTPTGINSENSRESQEVIDRAVRGGKLDDILQKNLVDTARELEELRALEARIRYETSKSPAYERSPVLQHHKQPAFPMPAQEEQHQQEQQQQPHQGSVLDRSEAESMKLQPPSSPDPNAQAATLPISTSTPGPKPPASPSFGMSPPRPWSLLKSRPSSVPSPRKQAPPLTLPASTSNLPPPHHHPPSATPLNPDPPPSEAAAIPPSVQEQPPSDLAPPSPSRDHNFAPPQTLSPPSHHTTPFSSPPPDSQPAPAQPPVSTAAASAVSQPSAPISDGFSLSHSLTGRSAPRSPNKQLANHMGTRTITTRPEPAIISPLDRRPPVPLAPCASPDVQSCMPPGQHLPPPMHQDTPDSPGSAPPHGATRNPSVSNSTPSTPSRAPTSGLAPPPTPNSPHTPAHGVPRPRSNAALVSEQRPPAMRCLIDTPPRPSPRNMHETPPKPSTTPREGNTVAM